MNVLNTEQKGQALALSLLLTSLVLVAVIALAMLSRRELSIAADIKDSAIAVVAADSGVERALFEFWINDASSDCTASFSDPCIYQGSVSISATRQASYEVAYDFDGNDGDGDSFADPGTRRIEARGTYPCASFPCNTEGAVQRAFEVTF